MPGYDDYQIYLTTDRGGRLATLVPVGSFSYGWAANDITECVLNLSRTFDPDFLQRDRMIQIWRQFGERTFVFPYFIYRWRRFTQQGSHRLRVWGYSPNIILRWREVAYYVGSNQGSASAEEADDLMKRIFDENFLTCLHYSTGAADNDREWSEMLSVQANATAGPQITREFGWRDVLTIMQEISEESDNQGTHVWFDVAVKAVDQSSISFEFRTKTDQPGADLTSLGVVFSEGYKNLKNGYLDYDYGDEKTYVYGLGQGPENNRIVSVSEATGRRDQSYWGRKEAKIHAGLQKVSTAGVASEANAKLAASRPRIAAGGEVVSTDAFSFGHDWGPGDKVRVLYEGEKFDAILRAGAIQVQRKHERIQARLEYVS